MRSIQRSLSLCACICCSLFPLWDLGVEQHLYKTGELGFCWRYTGKFNFWSMLVSAAWRNFCARQRMRWLLSGVGFFLSEPWELNCSFISEPMCIQFWTSSGLWNCSPRMTELFSCWWRLPRSLCICCCLCPDGIWLLSFELPKRRFLLSLL